MVIENWRIVLLFLALLHGGLFAADAPDNEIWGFFLTQEGQAYFTEPMPTIEVITKDDKKFIISLKKLKKLSPVLRDMLEDCDPSASAKISVLSRTFLILTYTLYATTEDEIDFEDDPVVKELFWHEMDATELRKEFVELGADAASLLMKHYTSWRTQDEMHSWYGTIKSSTKDSERFNAYRDLYQYLVKMSDEEERAKFIGYAVEAGIDERLLQLPSKKFLQNKDYVQLVTPYMAWPLWERFKMPLAATLNIQFIDLFPLDSAGRAQQFRNDITKKSGKFVLKKSGLHGYDTPTQAYILALPVLLNALKEMGLEPALASNRETNNRVKYPSFYIKGFNKDG